jgi:hypothetical protein
MEFENLIIKAESRFQEWYYEQEQQKKSDEPRVELPSITLSRQYGCEALKVVDRVKEILDASSQPQQWTVVSREKICGYLLKQGFSQQQIEELISFDPKLGTRIFQDWKGFLFDLNWRTPEERAYALLKRYLHFLAERGGAIIVGLGGCVITQDLPNCLHYRLEASLDYRVQTIMDRSGHLTFDEAQKGVQHYQQRRDHFAAKLLGENLHELRHYHMVFNSERMKVEEIAQVIAHHAEARIKKPAPLFVEPLFTGNQAA